MENPYRIHSSIGLGFLQLLFMSSLAYPSPPPPVYHNIAIIRLMGTIYFTIFQEKPFYLKLECATILLEILCDILYIKYIILDYTYIFGIFDVISNMMICIFVLLSIQNGDINTKEIIDKMDDIRTTCIHCCFGLKNDPHSNGSPQQPPTPTPHSSYPQPIPLVSQTQYERHNVHMYKSIPSDERNEAPIYTFSGRQAFKPSFYNSSWGKEYIHGKVEREFDKIDKSDTEIGEIGMISGSDGTTQYIRFDEPEYETSGIHHYANIFVSPYLTKYGRPITWFSGCSKIDKIGACLFIYNVIQFIYQLMMYSSIITSCRAVSATASSDLSTNHTNSFKIELWLC